MKHLTLFCLFLPFMVIGCENTDCGCIDFLKDKYDFLINDYWIFCDHGDWTVKKIEGFREAILLLERRHQEKDGFQR